MLDSHLITFSYRPVICAHIFCYLVHCPSESYFVTNCLTAQLNTFFSYHTTVHSREQSLGSHWRAPRSVSYHLKATKLPPSTMVIIVIRVHICTVSFLDIWSVCPCLVLSDCSIYCKSSLFTAIECDLSVFIIFI